MSKRETLYSSLLLSALAFIASIDATVGDVLMQ